MSSNLRVDRILPSTGTEVGVGTATGSVALYGDVNVAGTLTYEDVTNIDSVGVVTARSDIYLGNDIYLTDGSSGYEKVEVDSNDIRVEHKHIHSEFGFWTRSTSINDRRNGIDGSGNDLRLYSNSTEKVRITSGGDLGLGVNGGMNQVGTLYIQGGQGVRWTHTTDGTLYGDHYVSASGHHVFRTGSGLAERLRITSDGQIGMGIASPTQESGTGLHIRGANGGQTRIHLTNSDTGDTATDGFYIISQGAESGGASGEVMLQQKENKALKFATNNIERLRITSAGDVGIGENNPTGNLEVNGNDGINISNATRTGTNGVQWRLIPHNGGGSATNLRLYEGAGGTEVINITKNGFVNIGGDFTQTSRKVMINGGSNVGQLEVKGTEADIWMNSSGPSGGSVWRVMGATGNNTHRWRVYDVTNSRDCINVINDGSVVTPAQPRFQARLTANTTYNPSGFGNHVDFDTEDYDVGGNFTTSGADQGLFTAPVTGMYAFSAASYAPGTNQTQSWFVVNSSRKVATDWVPNQQGSFVQNFQIIYLSAGDKVGYHPHAGGTGYQVHANTHHSYFKGCLLG